VVYAPVYQVGASPFFAEGCVYGMMHTVTYTNTALVQLANYTHRFNISICHKAKRQEWTKHCFINTYGHTISSLCLSAPVLRQKVLVGNIYTVVPSWMGVMA